ncbi:hypothetical protein AB6A40_007492 [Gnathostoma spinigerum]|uniref:RNA cytidine acetyltransferase n=1 Tax=Gnathostoma spinigerum TaxID=75299 RepID=A0ABD6ELD4_9BILA
MVRTKLDNRIRILIENGVALGHRSMFVIVGDKGRDQVPVLHHILSKAIVAARPSVLWCYKKELGFTSHRKKRMKEMRKKSRMIRNDDEPFDFFLSSTNIRYCYYAETHKILGNTFGMLVLQDFEALTPNLLARTVETVEGGGIIVILLKSVNSLKQIFTMSMDVHSRFRTESHSDIIPRFNERFILSLSTCSECAIMDDRFNILPLSSSISCLESVPISSKPTASEEELKSLVASLTDTKPIGPLLNKCRTACQAKVLLRLLDIITDTKQTATCSITAARGRGKSAALGLAVAGAIGFGYTNIFVTSPSPENLKTFFEFVIKGLVVIGYEEHTDFELVQASHGDFSKLLIRVNVFRAHRQTIQYIDPRESGNLSQAELLVIDECAAIPLFIVKELMSGPYIVFLASTVNGYEGTGRSLSLKLLQQLREQSQGIVDGRNGESKESGIKGRVLHELTLEESIRYKPGDQVENWLSRVLCLDATPTNSTQMGMPSPGDCELLCVNRDTLFSFHKASETFLHQIWSIYVSAHYKNSPNDLQMLSDAPAHHLFVLTGPVKDVVNALPKVFVVIQVCMEGLLSSAATKNNSQHGKSAAGDLLPWTISNQFLDSDFPKLSGARIVRIAVHPDYQSMGYGSRAIQLLQSYYQGEFVCEGVTVDEASVEKVNKVEDFETMELMDENIAPRCGLPPLLHRLTEIRAQKLDYIGVSFGLTLNLLKFWKRQLFAPVYIRQTTSDLTGEHTCIMLKELKQTDDVALSGADEEKSVPSWLTLYWLEFRRRFLHLLSYNFSKFSSSFALSILQRKDPTLANSVPRKVISRSDLSVFLSNSDLKRLNQYARNMVDCNLITDILPTIAYLFFDERLPQSVKLNGVQSAVLLGLGLQHKSMTTLAAELDLPSNQLQALFNKAIRHLSEFFDSLCKEAIAERLEHDQEEKGVNQPMLEV